MDGVVADFDHAMEERFGWNFETPGVSKNEKWRRIKDYNDNVEPWFTSLPPMADVRELWRFLTTNFEQVEILTATGKTLKDASSQKRAYIKDLFGYGVIVHTVEGGKDKAVFATPQTVLIDDRDKAIDPFIAAGGIGILHTSAATTIGALKAMMDDWD